MQTMKKILSVLAVLGLACSQVLATGTSQFDMQTVADDVLATLTAIIPIAVTVLVVFLGVKYGKRIWNFVTGR